MARWGSTIFDNSLSDMRSSYQASFDNKRAFGHSDLNDITAYAKAQTGSHRASRFTSNLTSYDNNRLNFITGGYKYQPAAGILPTMTREHKGRNFIQENFRDATRLRKTDPVSINLDEPLMPGKGLEGFINVYKSTRANPQTSQRPNPITHRSENEQHVSSDRNPRQNNITGSETQNQNQFTPFRSRAPRVESPYSHVTSRRTRGENNFGDVVPAETNNFMAPGGLNLDIHGHTSSRGEKALNDSPTVMGSQRSPRRSQTQRHTVAMVDRDGNMVRWVENDPAIRYESVADLFDEKLKKKDEDDYNLSYGNKFDEETEKQISGTFGAAGGPLPSRSDMQLLESSRRPKLELQGRKKQSTDLAERDERPKLYRNITSWRGDNQWGESTYNSTFSQMTQNDMNELERLMALPLKDVAPKSGLKNIVEVSTNTGRKHPALFMT